MTAFSSFILLKAIEKMYIYFYFTHFIFQLSIPVFSLSAYILSRIVVFVSLGLLDTVFNLN